MIDMSMHVDMDFFLDGMIYCSDNAKKLAADARRLYRVNRFPTSGMLAISSLEEIGKILLLQILGVMYLQRKELGITKGEYWKEFHRLWKDHRLKQVCASWIDLLLFDEEAIELARHTMKKGDLFTLRNRFIYVDLDNFTWLLPKNSEREKALEFVEAAEDISEEVSREFNSSRRSVIMRDMVDPTKVEEFFNRRKEIIELLEREGFGEDND